MTTEQNKSPPAPWSSDRSTEIWLGPSHADAIAVREITVPYGDVDFSTIAYVIEPSVVPLITAAPDLLDACEEFVRKVDAGEARSTRSYQHMKAAIAKARGQQ